MFLSVTNINTKKLLSNIINRIIYKILTPVFLKKIILIISWRLILYNIEKRFQKYLQNQLVWVSRANIFVSFLFIFIPDKKLHTIVLIPINFLPVYNLLWIINNDYVNYYVNNNYAISEDFLSYALQASLIISDSYISYKINHMFSKELESANSSKASSLALKSIFANIFS